MHEYICIYKCIIANKTNLLNNAFYDIIKRCGSFGIWYYDIDGFNYTLDVLPFYSTEFDTEFNDSLKEIIEEYNII